MKKTKNTKSVMVHCLRCHNTFPHSQVKFLKSGADVCPNCKGKNACILGYKCSCGS